ncbi:hypothetical protein TNCV_4579991 [Trichonephila clavipes]|nr:hypothetical protein TNCV_4579991 [Trichonephila clavipes]
MQTTLTRRFRHGYVYYNAARTTRTLLKRQRVDTSVSSFFAQCTIVVTRSVLHCCSVKRKKSKGCREERPGCLRRHHIGRGNTCSFSNKFTS